MNIPNIKGLMGVGKAFVMANRPEILFGASVVATIGATVLAAKGGYEARGIVDEAQEKSDTPLTAREKANLTWHCYMPATLACLSAVGATTGLHIVHVKEKKALAAAALVALEEVKREAKEFEKSNLGLVTSEERAQVLESRAGENGESAIVYGDGEIEELYLIRDSKTGRDFWSNEAAVQNALLKVNESLSKGEAVELSEFYSHAGIAETEDSYDIGWNEYEYPELKWRLTVRDDGRPVREFSFRPAPDAGFRSRR